MMASLRYAFLSLYGQRARGHCSLNVGGLWLDAEEVVELGVLWWHGCV